MKFIKPTICRFVRTLSAIFEIKSERNLRAAISAFWDHRNPLLLITIHNFKFYKVMHYFKE